MSGTEIPTPEPRCDHTCLLDDGHVERGESHQYGYVLNDPTAAPTRPTREPGAGRWVIEDDNVWWEFGAGEAMDPEEALRNHVDNQQFDDAYAAFVALLAGEGTAQPDPEVTRLREENGRLRTALRLSEVALDDWERSYTNLPEDPGPWGPTGHALARLARIDAPIVVWFCPIDHSHIVEWTDHDDGSMTPMCVTCGQIGPTRQPRSSGEGTAPQVPAEVLCVRCHVSRRDDDSPLCSACKRPDYPVALWEGETVAIPHGSVKVSAIPGPFSLPAGTRVRVVAADAPQEGDER